MKILWSVVIIGLSIILLTKPIGVVFAQDKESFVISTNVSKTDVIVLSVIFPGLGQMTSGQTYKGFSFFLAETMSLILTINANENYKTKNKVYSRDLIEFDELADRGDYNKALSSFNGIKDRNAELDDLNTIRSTALIVTGVVYAYNIIDTIFFSPYSIESKKVDNINSHIVVNSTIIDKTPGLLLSKSF